MINGMDFYRLKFDYMGENVEDGKIISMKREDLVAAVNYSDAEKIAHETMGDLGAMDDSIKYEIVKTKIEELLLTKAFAVDKDLKSGYVQYYFLSDAENDTESSALFAVKVMYVEILDNGKKKKTNDTIYVPAENNREAYSAVSKYLNKVETRDWAIRDVKFDKAAFVLVTNQMHASNLQKMDNALL